MENINETSSWWHKHCAAARRFSITIARNHDLSWARPRIGSRLVSSGFGIFVFEHQSQFRWNEVLVATFFQKHFHASVYVERESRTRVDIKMTWHPSCWLKCFFYEKQKTLKKMCLPMEVSISYSKTLEAYGCNVAFCLTWSPETFLLSWKIKPHSVCNSFAWSQKFGAT